MLLTRRGDKKSEPQKATGIGYCMCGTKQKHHVPYRERERGESTRILQPKGRTTLLVCLCVRLCVSVWMKMLLHYNLLTTLKQAQRPPRSPSLYGYVSVFYWEVCNMTRRYADDMLRAVYLMGNVSQYSVCAAVPRNGNKLKQKIHRGHKGGRETNCSSEGKCLLLPAACLHWTSVILLQDMRSKLRVNTQTCVFLSHCHIYTAWLQ